MIPDAVTDSVSTSCPETTGVGPVALQGQKTVEPEAGGRRVTRFGIREAPWGTLGLGALEGALYQKVAQGSHLGAQCPLFSWESALIVQGADGPSLPL